MPIPIGMKSEIEKVLLIFISQFSRLTTGTKKGALNEIISSIQKIEVHMNKPFEVCLRLVLLMPTAAGPDSYRETADRVVLKKKRSAANWD